MARILAIDDVGPEHVAGPWRLATTPPGACAGPDDLGDDTDWIPAAVPGTAAAALRAAGRWSEAEPAPIHTNDVWYRTRLSGAGPARLRFEGLATLAEVWLDGARVHRSRSMFRAFDLDVDLAGDGDGEGTDLAICFRSLAADLARPHKRGRWRPRLATPGSLRHVRTSLLGFMPGWCPAIDAVGPFRPITRTNDVSESPRVVSADLRATLDGTTGRLAIRLTVAGLPEAAHASPARLSCDGREAILEAVAPDRLAGELLLPGVAPWWPHTHGEPRLHAVAVSLDGRRFDLGRVGFRTITQTRPFADGLGLAINGVPVFCRGACWTPADLVGLSGERDSYRPLLTLAREAGMNMLRVPGVTLYEANAFHDLCDELGILVWQDLMLANFDYPHDDPAFRDGLVDEVEQFLDRTQASPSLCVIGGGSEVWQQAAMLGLPREAWADAFAGETLPGIAARLRPDLVVVPNSPSGGDLPFSVRAGVAHYYGVGAYRRPLDDARRAEVGFASECLAFANVPEPASLRDAGLSDPNSERWAAAIPRDRGADWDFEDVRDHYLALLFGCDPRDLRRADPERYLTLARASVAEVMEATFAEWRRRRSPTAGGLVWFLRDQAPGASWGVIDLDGRPKSAWYALKRAFRPVQVSLSDEGLDGLHVHVLNETAAPLDGHLRLAFSDRDGRTVAKAERAIRVEPRGARTWSSADLLGRFFDAAHAYRFGPPAHSLGHASLHDAEGRLLAESFHFPAGRDPEPRPIGLRAELVAEAGGWTLRVGAERHALGVHIETQVGETQGGETRGGETRGGETRGGENDDGPRPSDNWFHLAPGTERHLSFTGGRVRPRGTVGAVNADARVRF